MTNALTRLALLTSMLFSACSNNRPTGDEIIGVWQSLDGASFVFNDDGTFIGRSLPSHYFTFSTSPQEAQKRKINGSGKWKLEVGQTFAEVKLHFTIMDGASINGFYSLLIAGTKGVLENKPPWYLFVWKEDEGGERYKFLKK